MLLGLLELRAFEGINDSSQTSSIEAAVGGRSSTSGYETLSPLRDNRSRALERSQRGTGLPDDRVETLWQPLDEAVELRQGGRAGDLLRGR